MIKLLLDANVLYPSSLRDLFLELARAKHFELYWSDKIIEEWRRAIKSKLNKDQQNKLNYIIADLHIEFNNSVVVDYEGNLTHKTYNRDKNDVHVIEAAIKAKVNYIVTFNTKDFTNSLLRKYDMKAVHPDRLLSDLILLRNLNIKDPVISLSETNSYKEGGYDGFINLLKNRGLERTARYLK
jgi:predicted nucleic acid-binding protein